MTRGCRRRVGGTAIVAAAIALGFWWFLRSGEMAGTNGAAIVNAPVAEDVVRVHEPRGRNRTAPDSAEEPDPNSTLADDALKPFRVTVHVTSRATGTPIVGASVAVSDYLGPSEAVARTDADGTAVATVAAHGGVWFRVTAPGFVRQPWSGDGAEFGANAAEVSVALQPGLALDGVVLDARTGAPLCGARVHVEELKELNEHFGGPPDDLVLGDADTAADGTFRLDVVPGKSTASVTVTAAGHAGEHCYVDPSDSRHLTFRLEPSGIVRGTVRCVDGTPAAGVGVAAQTTDEAEDSRSGAARTDAEGHYEMTGVALDRTYHVWAEASYDGAQSASMPRDGIRLTTEAPEATADLVLLRASMLGVTLRAPDGAPVVKALFSVQMASEKRAGSTNEEGHEVVVVTQPGPCRIVADVNGFLPCDIPVDVPEEATVRKEITLQRGLSLSGVVVDDTGAPVATAVVDAHRSEPRWLSRSAQSAEDGTFRIDGLDNDAEFDVEATADNWGHVKMEAVSPPRGDLRFVLTRGAEVTFRLAIPEGEPTPAYVRFGIKVAGSPAILTACDGDEQSFSGVLPSGRGEFVVRADRWAVARWPIELKPGQKLDLGEIVLDRGVVVAGRVIDAEGRGVAGAVVDAPLLDQDWHNTGVTLDPTATTDASGAFRLERVPVGDVELRVGADGFIEERRSVEVLRDPRPLILKLRRSH